MDIQQTLIQLNRYSVTQRPSLKIFLIWWHLGDGQLLCACDDLFIWLFNFEEDGCPKAMVRVGGDRASYDVYTYLFAKLPALNEFFVCFPDRIEFRESISMQDRLEVVRFVRSLPEPIYS